MTTLMKKTVRALTGVSVAMTMAGVLTTANAQKADVGKYPERPVHMIVAYAPGGATDIVARLVGAKLQERLGQPVVIDNKPGGGTNIGTGEAARSKPDGYTLLMATVAQAIGPAIYEKLPYDTLKDFDFVTMTMTSPSVLVVNKDVPIHSVQELIEWAKAHPGELSLASSGTGGSPHLASELFKLRTGIDYLHVPYKGGGPAMQDVLAGVVMGGFKTATNTMPQIRAGLVRPLAVAAPERLKDLPDVPTMAEAGVADFNVSSWNGLMVPKGTPEPIIDLIAKETLEALKDPEVIAQFESRASTPGNMSKEEFTEFVKKELQTWKEVADAAGVKIN
ncbi:Bug family tripartite tricarboxylate transporter substrate binding protein [Orrella sp. 11846]|uniref:Bug family tripartite tricarboxylate transporter substrate binding protein n=1 Tax=Orrella sp. 11846 TaxID=3409913 RepID=UPI003B5CA10C